MSVVWHGDRVLLQIENATDDGLFVGAQKFVELATPRAPRGATGNLQESGYAANHEQSTYRSKRKIHDREIKPEKGTAVAAFAAFYAKFVERGGPHRAARPFMRKTLDTDAEQIGRAIIEHARGKLR